MVSGDKEVRVLGGLPTWVSQTFRTSIRAWGRGKDGAKY